MPNKKINNENGIIYSFIKSAICFIVICTIVLICYDKAKYRDVNGFKLREYARKGWCRYVGVKGSVDPGIPTQEFAVVGSRCVPVVSPEGMGWQFVHVFIRLVLGRRPVCPGQVIIVGIVVVIVVVRDVVYHGVPVVVACVPMVFVSMLGVAYMLVLSLELADVRVLVGPLACVLVAVLGMPRMLVVVHAVQCVCVLVVRVAVVDMPVLGLPVVFVLVVSMAVMLVDVVYVPPVDVLVDHLPVVFVVVLPFLRPDDLVDRVRVLDYLLV